jgi:hypothetical protein
MKPVSPKKTKTYIQIQDIYTKLEKLLRSKKRLVVTPEETEVLEKEIQERSNQLANLI